MQLVERHVITKTHPFWSSLDQVCFASKNLYNKANYNISLSNGARSILEKTIAPNCMSNLD